MKNGYGTGTVRSGLWYMPVRILARGCDRVNSICNLFIDHIQVSLPVVSICRVPVQGATRAMSSVPVHTKMETRQQSCRVVRDA